jgi:hypothetical protein
MDAMDAADSRGSPRANNPGVYAQRLKSPPPSRATLPSAATLRYEHARTVHSSIDESILSRNHAILVAALEAGKDPNALSNGVSPLCYVVDKIGEIYKGKTDEESDLEGKDIEKIKSYLETINILFYFGAYPNKNTMGKTAISRLHQLGLEEFLSKTCLLFHNAIRWPDTNHGDHETIVRNIGSRMDRLTDVFIKRPHQFSLFDSGLFQFWFLERLIEQINKRSFVTSLNQEQKTLYRQFLCPIYLIQCVMTFKHYHVREVKHFDHTKRIQSLINDVDADYQQPVLAFSIQHFLLVGGPGNPAHLQVLDYLISTYFGIEKTHTLSSGLSFTDDIMNKRKIHGSAVAEIAAWYRGRTLKVLELPGFCEDVCMTSDDLVAKFNDLSMCFPSEDSSSDDDDEQSEMERLHKERTFYSLAGSSRMLDRFLLLDQVCAVRQNEMEQLNATIDQLDVGLSSLEKQGGTQGNPLQLEKLDQVNKQLCAARMQYQKTEGTFGKHYNDLNDIDPYDSDQDDDPQNIYVLSRSTIGYDLYFDDPDFEVLKAFKLDLEQGLNELEGKLGELEIRFRQLIPKNGLSLYSGDHRRRIWCILNGPLGLIFDSKTQRCDFPSWLIRWGFSNELDKSLLDTICQKWPFYRALCILSYGFYKGKHPPESLMGASFSPDDIDWFKSNRLEDYVLSQPIRSYFTQKAELLLRYSAIGVRFFVMAYLNTGKTAYIKKLKKANIGETICGEKHEPLLLCGLVCDFAQKEIDVGLIAPDQKEIMCEFLFHAVLMNYFSSEKQSAFEEKTEEEKQCLKSLIQRCQSDKALNKYLFVLLEYISLDDFTEYMLGIDSELKQLILNDLKKKIVSIITAASDDGPGLDYDRLTKLCSRMVLLARRVGPEKGQAAQCLHKEDRLEGRSEKLSSSWSLSKKAKAPPWQRLLDAAYTGEARSVSAGSAGSAAAASAEEEGGGASAAAVAVEPAANLSDFLVILSHLDAYCSKSSKKMSSMFSSKSSERQTLLFGFTQGEAHVPKTRDFVHDVFTALFNQAQVGRLHADDRESLCEAWDEIKEARARIGKAAVLPDVDNKASILDGHLVFLQYKAGQAADVAAASAAAAAVAAASAAAAEVKCLQAAAAAELKKRKAAPTTAPARSTTPKEGSLGKMYNEL